MSHEQPSGSGHGQCCGKFRGRGIWNISQYVPAVLSARGVFVNPERDISSSVSSTVVPSGVSRINGP